MVNTEAKGYSHGTHHNHRDREQDPVPYLRVEVHRDSIIMHISASNATFGYETETYVELDMVAGGEQLEGAGTCRYAYVHDVCGRSSSTISLASRLCLSSILTQASFFQVSVFMSMLCELASP